MSNGTRSCPSVTLPFGVFAGTNTIDPLDPSTLPPEDPAPGLEQFIIDNAPNDATPFDGFDQAFTDTVGIVDALDSALGSLEGSLLDAFSEADTIDPAPVGATVAGYSASLGPSSTAADNLGTLLTGAASPTPPAPAGGTPPGSVGTFDFVAVGPIGYTCSYPLTYTNNTGQADTVRQFTLVNDSAGVFEVHWPLPVTLAVGQSSVATVLVHATQLGEHTATFSVFTSNEVQPFIVTFRVNVLPNFVPCQGGPSTPPDIGRPGGGGGRLK
jgi:hypothetical protein